MKSYLQEFYKISVQKRCKFTLFFHKSLKFKIVIDKN